MSQYAIVVMVDHIDPDDALPELSSRRPRQEANRYIIAANDDAMKRIAANYALERELAYLEREEIPMIEIDAARLAAVSLDVGPQNPHADLSGDEAGPESVGLADLEQAIARIHSSQALGIEVPNAGAATVRAYLERIEAAISAAA